jgi:hypothetical protein
MQSQTLDIELEPIALDDACLFESADPLGNGWSAVS